MAVSELAVRPPSIPGRINLPATLSLLTGLLIPIYFLDDSVALKARLFAILIGVLLLWLFASGVAFRGGADAWRFALTCFAASYSISVASALFDDADVTVNAIYPFLFMALCFRRPTTLRPFFYGLSTGLALLVLFGWYRYFAVDGGVLSEHALGYWGIKYTEATRNSDALVPAIVTATAIAGLRQPRALWVRVSLWTALSIALPAVVLSCSRSAWIAVTAYLFITSGFRWRLLAQLAVLCIIAAAALMLFRHVAAGSIADVALFERAMSIVNPLIDSSNISRTKLLMYALELGLCNPVAGVGPGQFGANVFRFGYPELDGAMHPENLFMHLFSEYGMAASLSLLVLLWIACRTGLRSMTSGQFTAGAAMGSLMLWLQMNSELSSLFIWVMLGVISSAATNPHYSD